MADAHRSGCPINLTLEVVGDKWSLLILRDMMFGGRRHFRELLRSQEKIASNILADRLKMLVSQGILTKSDDPSHKQKALYSLTLQGIELLPVLAQMAVWGRHHLPVTEELSIRAQLLEEGGPKLWADFMAELRAEHLGAPQDGEAAGTPAVRATLQAAYEAVLARQAAEQAGAAPAADQALTRAPSAPDPSGAARTARRTRPAPAGPR